MSRRAKRNRREETAPTQPAETAAVENRTLLRSRFTAVDIRGPQGRLPPSQRSQAKNRQTTVPVTIAAEGKYMRCSTAKSVTGIKLEVGARIRKKQAPKKPQGDALTTSHTVATNKPATTARGGKIAMLPWANGQS